MQIILCLNRLRTIPDEGLRTNVIENRTDSCPLTNEEKYLVETGLNWRKDREDSVILIAAGLPVDQVMLREGLAMGCAKAFLISGRGKDLLRPGQVAFRMNQVINKIIGQRQDYMILTGERMMDGLYGFLGPQLAGRSGIPFAGAVDKTCRKIEKIHGIKTTDQGQFLVEMSCPAVITVVNARAQDRFLSVMDINDSFKKELSVEDLHRTQEDIPTDGGKGKVNRGLDTFGGKRPAPCLRIVGMSRTGKKKTCEMHDEISLEKAADVVMEKLKERKLI